jgi:hypothetical protein
MKKKDYIPSHQRPGFDESKVRKLKPGANPALLNNLRMPRQKQACSYNDLVNEKKLKDKARNRTDYFRK